MLELDHIRVRDAMHHGILSCAADAPLAEVAAMMAKHHVHAVAINAAGNAQPAGIVSDLDAVAAMIGGQEPTAAQAAASDRSGSPRTSVWTAPRS
jgi:CBS domain-containing protein